MSAGRYASAAPAEQKTRPDLGHAPQIQAPDLFHKALLEGMRTPETGNR